MGAKYRTGDSTVSNQNTESKARLTDLHRSLMRALETVPYDTTLLERLGMTVRQFRADANALLGVVRGLQDACTVRTGEPQGPGTKYDRRRRSGKDNGPSESW
jgi:hypothetical protein